MSIMTAAALYYYLGAGTVAWMTVWVAISADKK
jgi:hypothetical protein